MSADWVQFAFGALGAGGVVFGMIRGKRQDSDARIDERIQLAVGETLVQMRADISAIRQSMPTDFGNRFFALLEASERHAKDIEELYRRLREHENRHTKE